MLEETPAGIWADALEGLSSRRWPAHPKRDVALERWNTAVDALLEWSPIATDDTSRASIIVARLGLDFVTETVRLAATDPILDVTSPASFEAFIDEFSALIASSAELSASDMQAIAKKLSLHLLSLRREAQIRLENPDRENDARKARQKKQREHLKMVEQLKAMGPWTEAQIEVALATSKDELQPALEMLLAQQAAEKEKEKADVRSSAALLEPIEGERKKSKGESKDKDKEPIDKKKKLKVSALTQSTGVPGDGSFLGDLCSDEVLIHMFSYLDPTSLARCARVSKRWNQLSADRILWVRHNRKMFMKSKDAASSGKAFYARKMRERIMFRKQAEEQVRRQRVAREQEEARYDHYELYMYLMQTNCHDICQFFLMLLWVIFIALRLDNVVSWSWNIVAIPLYIFLAVFLARFISLYWFAEDYDLLDDEVVVNSFFAAMIREVWRASSPVLWVSLTLQILCLIASAILFHLKVNGSDIGWWGPFLPLWIAYFLCFAWYFDLGEINWRAPTGCLIVLLPWALFFVTLCLKLMGRIDSNMAIVGIPLWVGVPVSLCALGLIGICSDDMLGLLYFMFFVYGFLPGVFLFVFLVLVFVRVDGGLSHVAWRILFIPLWVGFVAWGCAATFGMFIIWACHEDD